MVRCSPSSRLSTTHKLQHSVCVRWLYQAYATWQCITWCVRCSGNPLCGDDADALSTDPKSYGGMMYQLFPNLIVCDGLKRPRQPGSQRAPTKRQRPDSAAPSAGAGAGAGAGSGAGSGAGAANDGDGAVDSTSHGPKQTKPAKKSKKRKDKKGSKKALSARDEAQTAEAAPASTEDAAATSAVEDAQPVPEAVQPEVVAVTAGGASSGVVEVDVVRPKKRRRKRAKDVPKPAVPAPAVVAAVAADSGIGQGGASAWD